MLPDSGSEDSRSDRRRAQSLQKAAAIHPALETAGQ
jgi:hypothetical protein